MCMTSWNPAFEVEQAHYKMSRFEIGQMGLSSELPLLEENDIFATNKNFVLDNFDFVWERLFCPCRSSKGWGIKCSFCFRCGAKGLQWMVSWVRFCLIPILLESSVFEVLYQIQRISFVNSIAQLDPWIVKTNVSFGRTRNKVPIFKFTCIFSVLVCFVIITFSCRHMKPPFGPFMK